MEPRFFGNDRPIVLELGCGRGEYTVALGERFPERRFYRVDVKGARLWRGAKTATENGMKNVAFLRTRIEFIDSCFAPGEVDEIWITFPRSATEQKPDQKRLTAPQFLAMYARFLREGGMINLKTDSVHLHEYTKNLARGNGLPVAACCDDIYGTGFADEVLSIKTTYEQRFCRKGCRSPTCVSGFGDRREFETIPLLPTKRCCRPELPYSGNSLIIYYPGRSCRDALFRICGAGIGTIIEFTETVRGRVCPKPFKFHNYETLYTFAAAIIACFFSEGLQAQVLKNNAKPDVLFINRRGPKWTRCRRPR